MKDYYYGASNDGVRASQSAWLGAPLSAEPPDAAAIAEVQTALATGQSPRAIVDEAVNVVLAPVFVVKRLVV